MRFAEMSLNSPSLNGSGLTMLVLAVLWATMFSSVQATILGQRYGGPVRRPPPPSSSHFSFLRPNAFQHGSGNPVSIPSPTHAYPIFARPPQQQQQQQQQQYQAQPPSHAFHTLAQQLHNHQIRLPNHHPIQQQQQQQQQQYSAPPTNGFQPMVGPQQNQPRPVSRPQHHHQQQSIYYGQPQHQQQSYNQQNIQYQTPSNAIYGQPAQYQSASYYQPQSSASSTNYQVAASSSYYPQQPQPPSSQPASFAAQSQNLQTAATATHFHYNKLNNDAATGTYEPCTSNHWQPILGAGSSVTPAVVPPAQTNSFFGSSRPVSTGASYNPSFFRYQPESSNNKVVVLSHDVLKTLLSNSKTTSSHVSQSDASGTKGFVDNVVSSSFVNPTIVPSNSITKVSPKGEDQQPSVKLVGYIGPASQKTPTGYMQIPISKQSLVSLSGSALKNFDLATNSSNYSLFTMKSVNDIQSLMSGIKSSGGSSPSGDQETSASQNIPMGLVVSNEQKQQQQLETSLKKLVQADTMFYPVSTGAAVSNDGSKTSGGAASNPSVHMVGHVQITSPDVSTHFNKRLDTEETLIATS